MDGKDDPKADEAGAGAPKRLDEDEPDKLPLLEAGVEPKRLEFPGPGAGDPKNPPVGAGAEFDPKGKPPLGAGAFAPNAGAGANDPPPGGAGEGAPNILFPGAGAGADPKVGAGVDPKVGAGAGLDEKV